MRISTKGRYALQIMLALTRYYGAHGQNDRRNVTLKEISEAEGISVKYLEQIIPSLKRAGFLRSLRGNSGGYSLARAPEQITILDILDAAEGTLAPVPCLETAPNNCAYAGDCATVKIWEGLYDTIKNYLGGITLDSVSVTGDNFIYMI